jgi:nitroreductase
MFSELVRQARSTRRFDASQPIPTETVRQLVDIARVCPSGANLQPLRYRMVTEASECEAVFPFTAWAGALADWPGPDVKERPTAYIVACSSAGQPSPDVDLGIACQTIQLAASSMGYGGCMLGAIRREQIHAVLHLPEDMAVRLLVALGKPAETIVLEEVGENGDTRYWRTPDEVHHVPKRSLGDVLL